MAKTAPSLHAPCGTACRTYTQLPETVYYQTMEDGLPAFKNDTRTLWE